MRHSGKAVAHRILAPLAPGNHLYRLVQTDPADDILPAALLFTRKNRYDYLPDSGNTVQYLKGIGQNGLPAKGYIRLFQLVLHPLADACGWNNSGNVHSSCSAGNTVFTKARAVKKE
jgi:hypothetical protein